MDSLKSTKGAAGAGGDSAGFGFAVTSGSNPSRNFAVRVSLAGRPPRKLQVQSVPAILREQNPEIQPAFESAAS